MSIPPPPPEPVEPAPAFDPLSPRALLAGARTRLAAEGRWLHGSQYESVDSDGHGVLAWSAAAARWDVYGALAAEAVADRSREGTAKAVARVLDVLAEAIGDAVPGKDSFTRVYAWHDAPERAHGDVLELLDRALGLAPP